MAKPIYLVGGGKGGVGKSLMSVALLDYLIQQQEPVMLMECDNSNSDVWKAYKEAVPSEIISLDDIDGWMRLVNVCESIPNSTVVINTAARNNRGIRQYGVTLNGTLAELQRALVIFWVINRQRDSLELLWECMEALSNAVVHVVRNTYFGPVARFELYEGSDARKAVEGKGGKSVNFPDLADRVADDLNSQRLTLAQAAQELPIGNRAELNRWRQEVAKMLEPLLGHA